jgi:hypothetical protein
MLGRTPLARFASYLKFVQEDSAAITDEEVPQRDDQLVACLALAGVTGDFQWERGRQAQARLRGLLRQQLELGLWRWSSDAARLPLGPGSRDERRACVVPESWYQQRQKNIARLSRPRDQLVLKAFADLIDEVMASPDGTRVQRCARRGCERLFVKHRRGRYCTPIDGPRCKNAEGIRRYRTRQTKGP